MLFRTAIPLLTTVPLKSLPSVNGNSIESGLHRSALKAVAPYPPNYNPMKYVIAFLFKIQQEKKTHPPLQHLLDSQMLNSLSPISRWNL